MAENSKIAWTDNTYNPWIGCSRRSPGCDNCYAENLMDVRYGRVEWGPGKPRSRTKTEKDVRKWHREATNTNVRKKVFCASLADWLDPEVDINWLGDLLKLVAETPMLDWLLLTKRIELWEDRLHDVVRHTHDGGDMFASSWLDGDAPDNVWLGVTAENQKYWDRRVWQLLGTPALVRWVSYEPSLGPIELTKSVDWVIIGGESDQIKPGRPFHIEWAESVIEQCRQADGTAPFVKQLGSNAFYHGKPFKTNSRDGSDPSEWPTSIQIREFPNAAKSRQTPV